MEIRVSVIIPTCDRPDLLQRALDSVFSQSAVPQEVIVVDNGLNPVNRSDINDRVTLIRGLPRFGVAQARNLGAVIASGTHLAFLDDDDCWDHRYLEEMISAITRADEFDVFLPVRMEGGKLKESQSGAIEQQAQFFQSLLMRNPGVTGSSLVVSSSAFKSTAGFDPYLVTGEDMAIVIDLMRNGFKVLRVTKAVMIFIGPDNNVRLNNDKNRYKGKLRFIRKYWSSYGFISRIHVLGKLLKRFLLGGKKHQIG